MRSVLALLGMALVVACGAPGPAAYDAQKPNRSAPSPARVVREPSDAELSEGRLVVVLADPGAAPRRRVDRGLQVDREAVIVDAHTVHAAKVTYPGKPSALGDEPLTGDTTGTIHAWPQGKERVRCEVDIGSDEADGMKCRFDRTDAGALRHVELLTSDQLTGDADDEGDGLIGHDRWPSAYRLVLRLLSAPFPTEEIGVGARWDAWDRARLDDAWTKRHVRYVLSRFTVDGAELAVEVDERAPAQTYDRLAEARDAVVSMLMKQFPGGTPQGPLAPGGMATSPTQIHGASLHVTGRLEVAFGHMLPRAAALDGEATYDVEERTVRYSGRVTRSFRVRSAK